MIWWVLAAAMVVATLIGVLAVKGWYLRKILREVEALRAQNDALAQSQARIEESLEKVLDILERNKVVGIKVEPGTPEPRK